MCAVESIQDLKLGTQTLSSVWTTDQNVDFSFFQVSFQIVKRTDFGNKVSVIKTHFQMDSSEK